MTALTLEIMSMSLVWFKWSAVKAASAGSDNKATIEGVLRIRRISLWRLVLIDMAGWTTIFWATIRVLKPTS